MGKLPKLKIVIKDNNYIIENIIWWASEGVSIWWDWLELRPHFGDVISRTEAALSVLYADPSRFRIGNPPNARRVRISKLSAPHELELIDERSI